MAAARLPYWCDLWNNLHFWLLGIRKVKGRKSGAGINSVKGVAELAGSILIAMNQHGRIKSVQKISYLEHCNLMKAVHTHQLIWQCIL